MNKSVEKMVVMVCCVCKRTREDKAWIKKEPSPSQIISHGYCPSCFSHAQTQIKDFFHHRGMGNA